MNQLLTGLSRESIPIAWLVGPHYVLDSPMLEILKHCFEALRQQMLHSRRQPVSYSREAYYLVPGALTIIQNVLCLW